jgi:hypothetical protein
MRWLLPSVLMLLSFLSSAMAGEVEIVTTIFASQGKLWQVSATLRHDDTGWNQYADAWRVVSADGTVLGTRVLYHPHEHEQPFTRSLDGVTIPADMHVVYVEAHCKVHGWSPHRVRVDLRQEQGERFRVIR